jgi:hypothetical protein
VIFSVAYLLARRLLGCLMVLARREVSKDAELLILRPENAVLRRQIVRVRYQPTDRLWLAALSRLIPRSDRYGKPQLSCWERSVPQATVRSARCPPALVTTSARYRRSTVSASTTRARRQVKATSGATSC